MEGNLIDTLYKRPFNDSNLPSFVFTESSDARICFDWIVCLVGCITVIFVPIQCVFGLTSFNGFHGFLLLLDAVMVFDMLMNANMAFKPQHSHATLLPDTFFESEFTYLEVRRTKILLHYLTGNFIIDALAMVPVCVLDLGRLTRGASPMMPMCNLQLLASLKLAFLWSVHRANHRLQRFDTVFHRLKMFYTDRELGAVNCVIQWCVLFLVFVHYMGSAFLYLGKFQPGHNTWVDRQEPGTPWEEYVDAFYWALVSSLTVGYGDILPVNYYEKVFTCVMLLVSTMIHSIIMGAVTVLLGNMSNRNHAFLEKLQNAYHFFKTYRKEIPKEMRQKVIRYMDFNWEQQNIGLLDSMMHELPDHLKRDVKVAIMQDLVRGCDLFKDVENNFVREIVMVLKQVNLLSGDCIFQEGDLGSAMFLVHRGTLEVIVGGFQVGSLSTGHYFGEVAIIFAPKKRTASVRATTNSQLLRIEKEDLRRIFLIFPGVYRKLEKLTRHKVKRQNRRNAAKVSQLCGNTFSYPLKTYKPSISCDNLEQPPPCLKKSEFAEEIDKALANAAQANIHSLGPKMKAVGAFTFGIKNVVQSRNIHSEQQQSTEIDQALADPAKTNIHSLATKMKAVGAFTFGIKNAVQSRSIHSEQQQAKECALQECEETSNSSHNLLNVADDRKMDCSFLEQNKVANRLQHLHGGAVGRQLIPMNSLGVFEETEDISRTEDVSPFKESDSGSLSLQMKSQSRTRSLSSQSSGEKDFAPSVLNTKFKSQTTPPNNNSRSLPNILEIPAHTAMKPAVSANCEVFEKNNVNNWDKQNDRREPEYLCHLTSNAGLRSLHPAQSLAKPKQPYNTQACNTDSEKDVSIRLSPNMLMGSSDGEEDMQFRLCPKMSMDSSYSSQEDANNPYTIQGVEAAISLKAVEVSVNIQSVCRTAILQQHNSDVSVMMYCRNFVDRSTYLCQVDAMHVVYTHRSPCFK